MSETQPYTQPPLQPAPNPANQALTWNMLCHLSSLIGYVGVPFGHILGPLLVWQLKKQEFPSVEAHGKASLNFQITMTIALAILLTAFFILSFICVGFLLLPVVILVALVGVILPIIAGVKANNGENYKYPFSIEFIK
jgi:uncharacterized Tic20 family protein